MYDYLDDHYNNQPQIEQANNTVTASEEPASNCTTNLYQSMIPITIPAQHTVNDFIRTDVNRASATANAESVKEEEEGEETYTVMHTPIVLSCTPALEDLHTWATAPSGNRKE